MESVQLIWMVIIGQYSFFGKEETEKKSVDLQTNFFPCKECYSHFTKYFFPYFFQKLLSACH